MPTFLQRLDYLRRADRRYLWLLILRKLGVRRVIERGVRVPLSLAGGAQLAYMLPHLDVDLLRRLLPLTRGAFVDVGANVGLTLSWLRLADPERPWVGFEPSPEACRFIRKLIAGNDFKHTTLIEAGLSDAAGHATLHAASGTDSTATMIRDFQGKNAARQDLSFEVEILPGANVPELSQPVGIVKIDVEGMELEVVRGLREVLQRERPVLFIEIIPVRDDGTERAARLRTRQLELSDELRTLGYKLVQIRDGTLQDVDAPLDDGDPRWFNYLAIHESRWDEVRPCL